MAKSQAQITLKEYYTDSKNKVCPEAKAKYLIREFYNDKGKLLKTISILKEDLRYYTDIGDFDAGGVTVAKLSQQISECRAVLREAGFKIHPSLLVMVKKVIADRDRLKSITVANEPMDDLESEHIEEQPDTESDTVIEDTTIGKDTMEAITEHDKELLDLV